MSLFQPAVNAAAQGRSARRTGGRRAERALVVESELFGLQQAPRPERLPDMTQTLASSQVSSMPVT